MIKQFNSTFLFQTIWTVLKLTPPPAPPPRLLSRPLMLCNTALSRPSLRLARSNISRSYEFLVMRRYTFTALFWPIRWQRAWACEAQRKAEESALDIYCKLEHLFRYWHIDLNDSCSSMTDLRRTLQTNCSNESLGTFMLDWTRCTKLSKVTSLLARV